MKVSVIAPVYNVADYIVEMVDALIHQTLPASEWELILVDDHGQDDSIERVRKHIGSLGSSAHIKVVETPVNSGPGVARNVGMDVAQGEYVAFIDSDDLVHPEMLQTMLGAAERGEAEICQCEISYYGGAKDGVVIANPLLPSGVFTEDEKRSYLVSFKTFSVTYLYRRVFLERHHLRFPAGRSSEDTNFLVKVLLCATRVASVAEPFYRYRIRPASLTTSQDADRWRQKAEAFDTLMAEVRARGLYEAYREEMDYIYLKKSYMVGALNYLSNVSDAKVGVLKEMQSILYAQVPHWKNNSYLHRSLKYRLLMEILTHPGKLTLSLLSRLLRRMHPAL